MKHRASTLRISAPTGTAVYQRIPTSSKNSHVAPNPNGSPASPFHKRTGGWREYSTAKNQWIHEHPDASSAEIDRASRRIAKSLGL